VKIITGRHSEGNPLFLCKDLDSFAASGPGEDVLLTYSKKGEGGNSFEMELNYE
jgi:hypothetical protein